MKSRFKNIKTMKERDKDKAIKEWKRMSEISTARNYVHGLHSHRQIEPADVRTIGICM